MKQMIKLGLILSAFAGAACVALALVNQVTAPAIEKVAIAKANAGMIAVFPEADSFKEVKEFSQYATGSSAVPEKLFIALKNEKTIGVVVQVTGPTYDKATLLVGINTEKKITGIKFLSLTDTPGFGQKAAEPVFYEQFAGKTATSNFVAGKDFDGISGATISTNGIAAIIKEATTVGLAYLTSQGDIK